MSQRRHSRTTEDWSAGRRFSSSNGDHAIIRSHLQPASAHICWAEAGQNDSSLVKAWPNKCCSPPSTTCMAFWQAVEHRSPPAKERELPRSPTRPPHGAKEMRPEHCDLQATFADRQAHLETTSTASCVLPATEHSQFRGHPRPRCQSVTVAGFHPSRIQFATRPARCTNRRRHSSPDSLARCGALRGRFRCALPPQGACSLRGARPLRCRCRACRRGSS